MTTAADVIAALNQRRLRKSLRPEVPGQLPSGWQAWLDAQRRVDAHAPGAPAPVLVEALALRPPRPVPRSPAMLGRWAAFASLLRQEWTPDLREERRLRIGVTVTDIVLHTILIGLLLWLMYLRFLALSQVPEEEEAVQVEFIGRGNRVEGGGALAPAGAPSAEAAATPARRAPAPAPASGSPQAPAIEAVATPPAALAADTPIPERVRELSPPVAAEAAQPLQVSEVPTPQPEVTFRLPPPRERKVALPQPVLREVAPTQQVEDIPTVPVQQVRTLQPRAAQAQLRVPQLNTQPTTLDVPQPQRMPEIAARAAPAVASRQAQVRVPELRGEVRDIPMPPGGSPTPSAQAGNGTSAAGTRAEGADASRGNAPAAGQAAAGTGAGERSGTIGDRGVAAAGSGAGPAAKQAPGGWPGPARSDDWGASSRNVAGTGNGNGDGREGDGLFDKDGRVRLPDAWSQQSGIDIDRAGTWLKRPGLEYRGTRFDQYWIPQGNLLEEWVRRGLKKVAIPIPGTRTRLECVVSLLQLGAGCYPVNPDVNEQPATARPPPAIPFKPGLQEDNGSLPSSPPAAPVLPAAGES